MTENTLEKLAQLLEQDQFELIFSESGTGRGQDIRLVYLMNDAVESFLVFIEIDIRLLQYNLQKGKIVNGHASQLGKIFFIDTCSLLLYN